MLNGGGLVSIAVGGYGACGLKTNGGVWCWGGYNNSLVAQQMVAGRQFSELFMGASPYTFGKKLEP